MSYVKTDGTFVYTESSGPLFAAQSAVTGSGNTASHEVGGRSTARLTLNVTAATGTTPSLTVNVQTSNDGTTWTTVASFPSATAAGSSAKVFGPLDRFVRAQWAAPTGTTPSFNFNISGDIV